MTEQHIKEDAALIRSLQGDGYRESLLSAIEGLRVMTKAAMLLEAGCASDLICNDQNDGRQRADLIGALQSLFGDRARAALCQQLLAEGLNRADEVQAYLNSALEIYSDDDLEQMLELIHSQQSRSTLSRIFNNSPDLGRNNDQRSSGE